MPISGNGTFDQTGGIFAHRLMSLFGRHCLLFDRIIVGLLLFASMSSAKAQVSVGTDPPVAESLDPGSSISDSRLDMPPETLETNNGIALTEAEEKAKNLRTTFSLPKSLLPAALPEASIVLADNVTEAMRREAGSVKETLEQTATHFFTPDPLGFSIETFPELYRDVVQLPLKLPRLVNYIVDQARLLGFIGSMVIILFLSGLTYMLTGQRKVLNYLETIILPMIATVPKAVHPYLKLVLKLAAAAMFPGVFWIIFWFVQSFTRLDQPWFLLIGRLMVVWAAGVAGLVALKELFIARLIPIPESYGRTIYRVTRIFALYIVFTVITFYCAAAFQINPAYLALLKVVLYLTVVIASLGLLAKKQAILSLLPDLPYRGYTVFRNTLTRVYTPAMIGTFLTGVLWSFGYRDLCRYIWTKTWAVAMAVILIMLVYHFASRTIQAQRRRYLRSSESADNYYNSLSTGLVFITALVLFYAVFSLLGMYAPIKRLASFPVFYAGVSPISAWTGIRAFMTIFVFYKVSGILRGYLDMKVFPALGVEEGLAYSINTFIGYILIIVGTLFRNAHDRPGSQNSDGFRRRYRHRCRLGSSGSCCQYYRGIFSDFRSTDQERGLDRNGRNHGVCS